jgi:hypothetical protein
MQEHKTKFTVVTSPVQGAALSTPLLSRKYTCEKRQIFKFSLRFHASLFDIFNLLEPKFSI